MAVVVRTDAAPAHSPDGHQAARPSPGDVIRGRILKISPDGQTTLQIGPHRVATDRPLGGRAGDLLLFEVLPSVSKPGDGAKSSEPLVVRLLESTRPATQASGRTIPQKASLEHLPSASRVAARAASTPIAVENQGHAHAPPPLVVSALQLVDAFRVLGRNWFQRSRRRLAPADPRESDNARSKPRPRTDGRVALNDRATARDAKTVQRATDLCGDYAAGFKLALGRDHSGKAWIKLQDHKTGKSGRESGGTLTAWLALDLKHTGKIEVDMQMSAHLIRVVFRTDNESMGEAIRSEAGRIRTALRHLVPEVNCCVRVDNQRLMDEDALSRGSASSNTGIDCTI